MPDLPHSLLLVPDLHHAEAVLPLCDDHLVVGLPHSHDGNEAKRKVVMFTCSSRCQGESDSAQTASSPVSGVSPASHFWLPLLHSMADTHVRLSHCS